MYTYTSSAVHPLAYNQHCISSYCPRYKCAGIDLFVDMSLSDTSDMTHSPLCVRVYVCVCVRVCTCVCVCWCTTARGGAYSAGQFQLLRARKSVTSRFVYCRRKLFAKVGWQLQRRGMFDRKRERVCVCVCVCVY